MPEERQRSLASGMNDYLSKPFKPAQMWQILQRWAPTSNAGAVKFRGGAPRQSSTPVMNDHSIDRSVLNDLREVGGEDESGLFAELLMVYLDETPQRIAEMHQAVDTADRSALGRAAHKLRGSSGCYGAMRLARLCEYLESQAINGQLTEAERTLAQLETEFALVAPLLRNEAVILV